MKRISRNSILITILLFTALLYSVIGIDVSSAKTQVMAGNFVSPVDGQLPLNVFPKRFPKKDQFSA